MRAGRRKEDLDEEDGDDVNGVGGGGTELERYCGHELSGGLDPDANPESQTAANE